MESANVLMVLSLTAYVIRLLAALPHRSQQTISLCASFVIIHPISVQPPVQDSANAPLTLNSLEIPVLRFVEMAF